MCSLLDQERKVTAEKKSLITELSNEVSKEQAKVSLLNDQITEMNSELKETEQLYVNQKSQVEKLMEENNYLNRKAMEYDDMVCEVEDLKQKNHELMEVEGDY